MPDTPMRDRILEVAEARVRAGGYGGVSFREIAREIGIKSASVHYHFPTKADLGEALVAAYADRFRARLAGIDRGDLGPAFDAYIGLYDEALVLERSICLCAILGAEAIALPGRITARTAAFFAMNTDWLRELFERHLGRPGAGLASLTVAALEGAMILASTTGDRGAFDRTATELRRLVAASGAPGG